MATTQKKAAAQPAQEGNTYNKPHDDTAGQDGAPAAGGIVHARVLVHCNLGEPNDVIEVDTDQVAQLGDAIDTDASAVAYALSLRA